MKILAICLGAREILPGKSYKTGINKHPVSHAVMVDSAGLVGDAICNRKHHGGVDQAVYLEGSLDLDWWKVELGIELPPGSFGENLVIEGLENASLAIGDRLAIGDVLLEITSARIPCATFAAKMGDPLMVKRYTKAERHGAYARVLAGGMLETGDDVRLIPFSEPRVLVREVARNTGRSLSDEDRARYLAVPLHHKLKAALLANRG